VNRGRERGTYSAMSASLPRSTSTLLFGLAVLVACDLAPSAVAGEPKTETSATAKPTPDAKTEPSRDAAAPLAKAPAEVTRARDAAEAAIALPSPDAPPTVAGDPAPAAEPAAAPVAAAAAEGAVVGGLSVVTHKVIAPARTGNSKEDYWTQYEVWGEITNHSTEVMEAVSGNLTFLDASGALIGIESIGTAIKQDLGDASPGETVFGAVHFVQPGQTVPFYFLRNLAAIKGDVASHRLIPRRGTAASGPTPRGVAVDVKEGLDGEGFHQRRMFEGTIRNDGEGGCRAPAFVVAFLDDAGKVAHIDSFDATDDLHKTLAKGETIAFSGGVYIKGDDMGWRETAKVKTYVDCQPIY
jgi:hypothetical protein